MRTRSNPVYSEQPFSLGLITEELADFDESGRELSAEFVEYLGLVLEQKYTEPFASGVNAELAQLSPVRQAEAMSWLARAADALHDNLAEQYPKPERSDQVRALHEMLGSLQADAARRIADGNDLGELTVTPLEGQHLQLLEALAPTDRAVHDEAPPGDFRKSLDGQDLDFGDRLRQAFLEEIDNDEKDLVRGRGPAERAQPGNLYSADHIQQIADLMRMWVAEVFGGLVPVPERMAVAEPGHDGEIYDGYAYREWEWKSWSQQTYREEARRYFDGFLLGDRPTDKPASVAAEHGADVSFTWPFNDETKIADLVMNDLLKDPQIVKRINEIERGWLGRHDPDSGDILLSFFREEGKDTETLWGTAYRLVHEIMHHLEHPEFDRWESSFHSIELATLKEGIPTLLGDMVWSHAVARLMETGQDGRANLENWNRIILGPFYTDGVNPSNLWDQALPHRYEAVTQATRLVSLVGIESLLAAFFGGQWWKIAGPAPRAYGSILAPRGWTEPSPSPSRTPSPSASTSPDDSSSESSDSSSESSDGDSGGDPGALEDGWEWLDLDRRIAVPTDRDLTGDVQTERAQWRAAEPGPGRRYAVHLPTGMIAAPAPGSDGRHEVHQVSRGWHHDGPDLVHRSSRAVLRGPNAAIGQTDQGRVDRVIERSQSLLPAVRDLARQANRDDLLAWLVAQGGLVGPIPGLVTGTGWQQATDQGAIRWVWNGPGPALELPHGLPRGTASGAGMACLVDSLSQLMRPLRPETSPTR